ISRWSHDSKLRAIVNTGTQTNSGRGSRSVARGDRDEISESPDHGHPLLSGLAHNYQWRLTQCGRCVRLHPVVLLESIFLPNGFSSLRLSAQLQARRLASASLRTVYAACPSVASLWLRRTPAPRP